MSAGGHPLRADKGGGRKNRIANYLIALDMNTSYAREEDSDYLAMKITNERRKKWQITIRKKKT
jgi:hypothetical protein